MGQWAEDIGMDGQMDGPVDGMEGWTDGRMAGRTDGCMVVGWWMDGRCVGVRKDGGVGGESMCMCIHTL